MARTADAARARGPDLAARPRLTFGLALARRSFVLELTLTREPPRRLRCRWRASSATSFVYTMWLKRTTPQNIVIGGAAGAVPPLVGWAAATGGSRRDRDLPLRDRLLLDAAALLGALAAHEGRVRERSASRCCPSSAASSETRRQILLYTVLLYAVTQLPFCAGGFGGDLPRSARSCWAPGSSAAPVTLYRRADRRTRAAPLPLLAALPRAAVRLDGGRRQALGVPASPWIASSPARTSARR